MFLDQAVSLDVWVTRRTPVLNMIGTREICSDLSSLRIEHVKGAWLKHVCDKFDVVCLLETHGTHEYLQAVAVRLPDWNFVGTFTDDNRNARGCAILTRRSFTPR